MRAWSTIAFPIRVFAGVAITGLLAAAAGSFLPWLRSGSVDRDSYVVAAVIDHVLDPGPVVAVLLRAWSAVPLVAVSCVALFVLGLWRTASVATALVSVLVGTAALSMSVQSTSSESLVAVTLIGPATTTCGTVLALVGAVGVGVHTLRPTAAGRDTGPIPKTEKKNR